MVRFEPLSEGRTRLTVDADFTVRRRLGRLILPFAALAGRIYGAREMDGLARVAERDGRSAWHARSFASGGGSSASQLTIDTTDVSEPRITPGPRPIMRHGLVRPSA